MASILVSVRIYRLGNDSDLGCKLGEDIDGEAADRLGQAYRSRSVC